MIRGLVQPSPPSAVTDTRWNRAPAADAVDECLARSDDTTRAPVDMPTIDRPLGGNSWPACYDLESAGSDPAALVPDRSPGELTLLMPCAMASWYPALMRASIEEREKSEALDSS